MFGLQKRLERLKSTSTIAGGFVSPPAPPPSPPPPPDDRDHDRNHGGDNEDTTGSSRSVFSLLFMGISTTSATPATIKSFVDDCLRSTFDFAPRPATFLRAVHLCRNPVDPDEYFAVVVFHSKLVAELFLELYSLHRTDFPSGFAARGRKVCVERNHKSGPFSGLGLLGKHAVVYLNGLPSAWTDVDKLRLHFERLLQSAKVDFGSNLVKLVQILPGAAFVGFSSKAVVDLLLLKCKRDRSLLGGISQDLVMVAAKADMYADGVPEEQIQDEFEKLTDDEEQQIGRQTLRFRKHEPQTVPQTVEPRRDQQAAAFQQRRQPQTVPALQQAAGQPQSAVKRTEQAAGQPQTVERRVPVPAFNQHGAAPDPEVVQPHDTAERRPVPAFQGADQDKAAQAAESEQQQKSPAPESLYQRSVFLLCSNDKKVNYESLYHLIGGLLELARPQARPEEKAFRIYTGPQIVFASEAMADALMDFYVTCTERFYVEDCPFSVTRHKLYVRPGAAYRQQRSMSISKTLVIANLGGLRLHEELLKGAVSEMLDRILLTTGLLTAGRSLLDHLSYTSGVNYAVATLEEPVAEKLLVSYPSFALAGRTVCVTAPAWVSAPPGPEQTTLFFKNLPTTTASYNPDAVLSLLRRMVKKVRPDIPATGILFVWSPGNCNGRANLQSESLADAIMDAYVAYTEEFCMEELPFTIYRHVMYQRPGARYLPAGYSVGVTRQLVVLGLGGRLLHPMPLRGALNELLASTLAVTGVLEYGQSPIKSFFYHKSNSCALVTVDENVAQVLVTRSGLTLGGGVVSFVIPAPPARPMSTPSSSSAPSEPRTGGWIDEEDGEIVPDYMDHCMQATLQSYGYTT